MKQPQMKIGDVSRLTGVRDVTLSRWLDRNTIKPSRNDRRSSGTGDHRIFSRSTINNIAIAKQLINLGLKAGPANAAAATFTESGGNGRAANELWEFGLTVLVHTGTGITSIVNIDPESSLSAVFGRSFNSAILVNIGPVIKTVDEAIISNRKNK